MKNKTAIYPSNYLELEQAKQSSPYLTAISGDFMSFFNLSHIWVSKYFFNGCYMDLTNDLEWKNIMVSNNFYKNYINIFLKPLSENQASKNSLHLLWQTEPASPDPLIAKTKEYGIISHFNLMFIHNDHIENYGFGSPDKIEYLNKILQNKAEVELFCLYLREKLYSHINSNSVALGFSEEKFLPPPLKSKYSHSPIPDSFTFSCNSYHAKITRREVQCVSLIAQGYSQKEIGRILGISPRTVEFHLTQIRLKFNNPSKLELLMKFNASPLALIDPFLLMNSSD